MTARLLDGRHILVVEDEYLLAEDMRDALGDAGAAVIGPVGSIDEALALIDAAAGTQPIDAAVIDVNLGGRMVYPVADALIAARVPFAFTTGYDRDALPDRFAAVPRIEKPVKVRDVAAILVDLIASPLAAR